MTAAAFLVGVAFGLIGYAWITAPERRRRKRALGNARRIAIRFRNERDHYRRKYGESAVREAVHLAPFGGDNPLALDAEVAVDAKRGLYDDIAAAAADDIVASFNALLDAEATWAADEGGAE